MILPDSECHHAIATVYWETAHWLDAARWFRRVAFSNYEFGIYSAELYLNSLFLLADKGRVKRLECYELLKDDADQLACKYCGKPGTEVTCNVLRQIRLEVPWVLSHGGVPPTPVVVCGPNSQAGQCVKQPPLMPENCQR